MKTIINFIGKALVLIVGLLMILGGGSCAIGAGFNVFALIGFAFLSFGCWMLYLVINPLLTPSERSPDDETPS